MISHTFISNYAELPVMVGEELQHSGGNTNHQRSRNDRQNQLRRVLTVGFVVLLVGGFLPTGLTPVGIASAGNIQTISDCQATDYTAAIDTPGKYVLANDVQGSATCIEITADDVVLDGQGHTVEGSAPDNGAVGIKAESVTNVTLTDVEVRGWDSSFSRGLLFGFVTDGSIVNVTATANQGGIYLDKFNDGVSVTDSNASQNANHGLFMRDSTDNVVRNNTVRSNDFVDIQSNAGINNTFENNTLRANGDEGIRLHDNFGNQESTVANNTAINNGDAGFFTGGGSNNAFTDNVARGNGAAVELGSNAGSSDVDRLDVGESTAANTTVSLTGENVTVSGYQTPPDNPEATGIGRYVLAQNTTAEAALNLTLEYDDADLTDVDESTLELWHHNLSGWSARPGSSLSVTNQTATANFSTVIDDSSSVSTIGIFGERIQDPTVNVTAPTSADRFARGDIVKIKLEFEDTDTGTITFGDRDAHNVEINVTVRDTDGSGTGTLYINTFQIGHGYLYNTSGPPDPNGFDPDTEESRNHGFFTLDGDGTELVGPSAQSAIAHPGMDITGGLRMVRSQEVMHTISRVSLGSSHSLLQVHSTTEHQ
jgi:parallel beta-helix repeat protein